MKPYFLALALIFAGSAAHAQEAPGDISLFIPDQMILGEHYIGMVSYTGSDGPVQVEIKAPRDRVSIDDSVSIRDGESHALFSITPISEGEADISVNVRGEVYEKKTTITSIRGETNLLLIIPSQTRTEDLVGAVYLVDREDNPVIAESEIDVQMSSTTGISVPDRIIIRNGSTGATFQTKVFASGSVSASSGAMFDTSEIETVSTSVEVKIGLSPTLIRPNSFAYYVIWFEKDGEPYIPPTPVRVSLHTSNENISSLSKIRDSSTNRFKIEETFTFTDGVTHGKLYTHLGEVAVEQENDVRLSGTLTVSADGYGIDTIDFEVGERSKNTETKSTTYDIQEYVLPIYDPNEASQCIVGGTLQPTASERNVGKNEVDSAMAALKSGCTGDCEVIRDNRGDDRSLLRPNQIQVDIFPKRTFGEAYMITSFFTEKKIEVRTQETSTDVRNLLLLSNQLPEIDADGQVRRDASTGSIIYAQPSDPGRGCGNSESFQSTFTINDFELVFNSEGNRALATSEGTVSLDSRCELLDVDNNNCSVSGLSNLVPGRLFDKRFPQTYTELETATISADLFLPSQVEPPGSIDKLGIDVFISSDGAEHPSQWIVESEEIPTQAGILPVSGAPGSYLVSVTSAGILPDENDQAEFEIISDVTDTNSVRLVPLPTIQGLRQDLAFVYIVDRNGAVVDPKEEYGSGITVNLKPTNVFISQDFVTLNSPVNIIKGAFVEGPEASIIEATSGNLQGTRVNVAEKKAAPDGDVVIYAPDIVRAGEQFPATAHLLVDGKESLNVAHLIQADGGCMNRENGLFECNGDGRLSVFEDFGNSRKEIAVFRSTLDVDLIPRFSGPISIGGNYTLDIRTSVEDFDVAVDSRLPHTVSGDTIMLLPEETGDFDVTVIVTSKGYSQFHEDLQIAVNNQVVVEVAAVGRDGETLAVEASVTGTETDFSGTTTFDHPFEKESITVSFPESITYAGSGYEFVHVELTGPGTEDISTRPAITFTPESRSVVTANYKQVVLIEVTNGRGAGLYDLGEQVIISAPERNVMAFLVREVIDYWESSIVLANPYADTIFLVADTDMQFVAHYKTDYTYLVGLIGGIGALVTFMVFRSNNTYILKVGQLGDHIKKLTSLAKSAKPKKKKKEEKPDETAD